MDTEDREKYLKWFRHAKRLLDEKPFVYYNLFNSLFDDIMDEFDEFPEEMFSIMNEAGFTDSQVLGLLFIGSGCDKDEAVYLIEKCAWSVDRLWLASDDLCLDDDDRVYFMSRLLDNNLTSIISRLIAANWGYPRIIKSLIGIYSLSDIVSALSSLGSNDFMIIKALPMSYFNCSDIIDRFDHWGLVRIIRAFSSADFSYGEIYAILSPNNEVMDIAKAMFQVLSDPLFIIKIIYNNDGSDSLEQVKLALRESGNIVSNSNEIIEQLEISYVKISDYLENGYFNE